MDGLKTVTRRTDLRWVKAKKGDRLWVRETFAINCVPWNLGRLPKKRPIDSITGEPVEILYRADGEMGDQFEIDDSDGELPWRPCIFMNRWASRILLECTEDTVVEPLHAIREDDAKLEGVEPVHGPRMEGQPYEPYRLGFIHKWNELNVDRGQGWMTNPQVAVIRFKLLEVKTW